MSEPLSIVLAGGGTGGHVVPALAIADAFRAAHPGCAVRFIGTRHGMEARLVPARGYALDTVPGSRLVGGSVLAKIKGLANLVAAIVACVRLLRAHNVRLVLGVGGYASGAALLAARLLGLATAIHESNAVPGFTNKVLGKLTHRVLLGFEAAREAFPNAKVVVTGNPTRGEIAVLSAARDRAERAPTAPLRVLIIGGSQGSRFLNTHVPPALMRLAASAVGVEIRHQTGAAERDATAKRYEDLALHAAVEAFIDDMGAAFAWADVGITRAGASTVSELCAAGLPALLVPFPHAAGDHQAANAKAFEATGAGRCVREADWNEGDIVAWLASLARDPGGLGKLSQAALSGARKDAAMSVVRCCDALLEDRA